MKNRLRRILMALLTLALAVSMGLLIRQQLQYQAGAEEYAEAAVLAELPHGPTEPEAEVPTEEPDADEGKGEMTNAPAELNLAALREINGDVIGWIRIPGTGISYPLVQGKDNQYYLSHTWKGTQSAVGAIFLDVRCNQGTGGFHTIVYGHRMRNGSMFAALRNFSDQEYWRQHPWVEIMTDDGTLQYEIFAAYEANVDSDAYRLDFPDAESRRAFLENCLTQSVIDTGVIPEDEDRILTLSTCTGRGYDTRWVVQARLVDDLPA